MVLYLNMLQRFVLISPVIADVFNSKDAVYSAICSGDARQIFRVGGSRWPILS